MFKHMARSVQTVEAIVSKLFPAGCGWQTASIVADNASYLPTTLPFFLSVGLGEGLAVGLGHITYYGLKNKMLSLKTDMSLQRGSALQLGTAAAMSGTIWQPSVNLFSEYGFTTTALGTVGICGLTFLSGLQLSRFVWGRLDGITLERNNSTNLRNDTLLSVSVAGAAGLFVATDVSLANNFLAGYFGITEEMSNLSGIGTAGMSTAVGFTGVQTLQNTFMKKNWIDA